MDSKADKREKSRHKEKKEKSSRKDKDHYDKSERRKSSRSSHRDKRKERSSRRSGKEERDRDRSSKDLKKERDDRRKRLSRSSKGDKEEDRSYKEHDEKSRKRKRSDRDETENGNGAHPEPKKAKIEPKTIALESVLNLASDPKKKKLMEYAAILLEQKEKVESQRRLLEKNKELKMQENKGQKPATTAATAATQAPRKGIFGGEGPRELVVDDYGREVDVHGRVVTPVVPKHATLLINKRVVDENEKLLEKQKAAANPYYDPSLALKGNRKKRAFNWVMPGTYVKQAEELREEIKENIEKSQEAEKSAEPEATTEENNDKEIQALAREERKLLLGKVPIVEWWDKPFLKGYTQPDSNLPATYGAENEPIPVDDSLIDSNIMHPVPIKPPAEPGVPPPQPLKLTKTEQRRIVKQTRQGKREEEQNKILLGLKDPPPPRVRIVNMHRVYGAEAMQDPTAIEIMVRKEMAEREMRHYQRNQTAKLTKEQRRQKKIKKLKEDKTLVVNVAVFKVLTLNTLNRQKIDINAQQNYLTGCCILGPNFHVVIIEGGPKAIRRYKKLMLRRMKWNPDVEDEAQAEEKPPVEAPPVDGEKMEIENENAVPEKKPPNRCDLIWEGEILQPAFNDFQMKTLRTELQVRKFLVDRGCVHYWDMAKHFIPTLDSITV